MPNWVRGARTARRKQADNEPTDDDGMGYGPIGKAPAPGGDSWPGADSFCWPADDDGMGYGLVGEAPAPGRDSWPGADSFFWPTDDGMGYGPVGEASAPGRDSWPGVHPFCLPSEDDGMGYELYGEALALGEDTFSSVESSSQIVARGHTTVARGYVRAEAVAEGEEEDGLFADAITDVTVFDADLTIIWTSDKSVDSDGVIVDVSLTRFFAIDLPFWEGNTTVVIGENQEIEIDGELGRLAQRILEKRLGVELDFDGNLANVEVEADALGENTFVNVDAYALAIEDQLSESSIFVTAAVG